MAKNWKNMGNCRNSPEMHGKPMLSALKTQNDLKTGNSMQRYVRIAWGYHRKRQKR